MLKIFLCSLFSITSCFAYTIENKFDLETNLLINALNAEDELVTRNGEIELPKIACISLGERCSAALNLRSNNLLPAYYPFDFIITPLSGLHILLKTKFENFLSKPSLKVTGQKYAWLDQNTNGDRPEQLRTKLEKMIIVKNKKTGCEFMHDFKDKMLHNFEAIAQKYARRIDRFYRTIEQAEHIYFFRTHLKRQEAVELHNLLKTLFLTKKFTLIAPTDPEYLQSPWEIAGVQEFLMYAPCNTNKFQLIHGDPSYWVHIFHTLNLI